MVAGGASSDGRNHSSTSDLLDLATNNWEKGISLCHYTGSFNKLNVLLFVTGPNLPHPLAYAGTVQYGDTVVAFGGKTSMYNMVDEIAIFDTEAWRWTPIEKTLKLDVARELPTAILVDKSLFPDC